MNGAYRSLLVPRAFDIDDVAACANVSSSARVAVKQFRTPQFHCVMTAMRGDDQPLFEKCFALSLLHAVISSGLNVIYVATSFWFGATWSLRMVMHATSP